jgi:serine protease inhibitor
MWNRVGARPALVLALGCSFLAACGGRQKNPARPDPFVVRQIPAELQADLTPVVEANTAFALSLYARLSAPEGNLFFSPYSISTALAMTWAGARDTTEQEMARTLHFVLPQERIHPIFAAVQQSLQRGAALGGYRLSIANRLWGQQGYPWLESFLSVTRAQYEAELSPLDFQSDPETCRQTINAWVLEKTAGKIEDLLPPGVLATTTRLVLTNAIYFKGRWESRFEAAQTQNRTFTLRSGQTIQVPTMQQHGEFELAETPVVSVLVLPYTGLDISMVILLPREAEGLAALEAQLTPGNLTDWLGAVQLSPVTVSLPRFRTTSEFALKPVLAGMGMASAFDPFTADFSGMDGRRDLCITEVVHKGFVEVNEEGTEAAAATGVIVGPTSAGRSFTADRPFVFLIRDSVTGSILFLGRIDDPR